MKHEMAGVLNVLVLSSCNNKSFYNVEQMEKNVRLIPCGLFEGGVAGVININIHFTNSKLFLNIAIFNVSCRYIIQ